jgi:histidine triad (HIT) family protein
MEKSIFTKIIEGDIPSHKIYEDELTFAFLDIYPSRPGHTLVVPKKQVDHLDDLPEEDYQALMKTVQKLMTHLKKTLSVNRTCLKVEGFDVPHAHVHLVPCNNHQDFYAQPPEGEPNYEELKNMVKKLKIK